MILELVSVISNFAPKEGKNVGIFHELGLIPKKHHHHKPKTKKAKKRTPPRKKNGEFRKRR